MKTANALPGIHHEIRLPGDPASVSHARSEVRRLLGHEHPAVDDVTLVTSELVTNAIKHSGCQAGDFIRFTLVASDGVVRVEVHDPGSAPAEPRLRLDPDAEDGRGLLIVDEISTEWGICERDDGPGRTVWCAIRFAHAPDSSSVPEVVSG
ncbi:ATP-binding protein [Sphaerimonospora thailandensis]|uniref:ATP-binding protein n=1 Tax=Sphaerimonospora thailandensis TaxID=795644 RepID=A0A8J3RGM1_9ACTN|nr:ATP-binding protein [Sphaerimonospora thailandensis]GIH73512.1 ATP-binding protein [Sphaerimonospora thailandensis]